MSHTNKTIKDTVSRLVGALSRCASTTTPDIHVSTESCYGDCIGFRLQKKEWNEPLYVVVNRFGEDGRFRLWVYGPCKAVHTLLPDYVPPCASNSPYVDVSIAYHEGYPPYPPRILTIWVVYKDGRHTIDSERKVVENPAEILHIVKRAAGTVARGFCSLTGRESENRQGPEKEMYSIEAIYVPADAREEVLAIIEDAVRRGDAIIRGEEILLNDNALKKLLEKGVVVKLGRKVRERVR